MIAKLKMAAGLVLKFGELVTTLRPGSGNKKPFKVLAAPAFLGGPATKLAQLSGVLAARGESYSTLFCFSAVTAPIPLLKILKRIGAKIVVNQNGVYYPQWYGDGWEKKNAYLRELCGVADHVFFQSEFARASFRHWVGEPPARSSILMNPVDRQVFHPLSGPRASDGVLRVLVFQDISEFTREPWEKALELRNYLKKNPGIGLNVEWRFMGRVLDSAVFEKLGMKASDGVFNVSAQNVADELRQCDVALHLIYNDVCPNKVLECLASGVPVIGLSAGGTQELVGGAGKIIEVAAGYDSPNYPPVEKLAEALKEISGKLESARADALVQAEKHDLGAWLEALRTESR